MIAIILISLVVVVAASTILSLAVVLYTTAQIAKIDRDEKDQRI